MALTKEYLKSLPKKQRQEEIVREIIKCRRDPIYMIENYFYIIDPETGVWQNFELYPHQVDAVKAFQGHRKNITMKTRQMGLTAIAVAYTAWYMSTKSNKVVNILANKLNTSKKFIAKLRKTLDDARKQAPWLIPDYVQGNNGKEYFKLTTNCEIEAQSNNDDACRGDTINLLVVDEVAAIDNERENAMEEIWKSAGLTITRSKGKAILISTPKGQSGFYYDTYVNAEKKGFNIVNAHWSRHPIYNRGMYKWIEDPNYSNGGYIKFYNNDWPDDLDVDGSRMYPPKDKYPFKKDGKLRSPWYDSEAEALGSKESVKCELDCSFAGSGGEVIDQEVINKWRDFIKKYEHINPNLGGDLTSYKEYALPDSNKKYALSCDVATGDGSDFSAITVIDYTSIKRPKVVATYKDQINTLKLAKVIKVIANRWNNPLVIIENNGSGLSTLMELKMNLKYKNIFYTKIKDKNPEKKEKSKSQKNTKIGLWQSERSRKLGGDKLEQSLNSIEGGEAKMRIEFYDDRIINEISTWIWDTDGKRRHAHNCHDDLIMCLQNFEYYLNYVEASEQVRRDINKNLSTSRQMTQWGGLSGNNSLMREMFGEDLEG